uniref:Uncharacterized protein n=1 Tax=Tetranychus urticae TaxID=32264 RepID=T1JRF1_TETUR
MNTHSEIRLVFVATKKNAEQAIVVPFEAGI